MGGICESLLKIAGSLDGFEASDQIGSDLAGIDELYRSFNRLAHGVQLSVKHGAYNSKMEQSFLATTSDLMYALESLGDYTKTLTKFDR